MAIFSRRNAAATDPVRRAEFAVVPNDVRSIFGIGDVTDSISSAPVDREFALSVPAVLRGRNLVAGTIGTLPLHVVRSDRTSVDGTFLDQPERGIPRSVTMARTAEDLLFRDRAYWLVTSRGWSGFPATVRRLDVDTVVIDTDGTVRVDGRPTNPADLIVFHGTLGGAGLLTHAARAIRTVKALDEAAANLAAEPLPLVYFSAADGTDPSTDEVKAFLSSWRAMRKRSATGYLPSGIVANQMRPATAEDIQLADARQHAVLEIARAFGVDAENLGVSTTSRTYFNAGDRDLAFLKYTLGPLTGVIEERLSMNDITPRGQYTHFVYDGLLRVDTASRYAAYEVGLRVGALAQDEIRALEDKPDITPTAPEVPQ